MKSETIRTRLESQYYIITTDELMERFYKEFDSLQDAYKYGLKLIKDVKAVNIELEINVINTSDDSNSNVVRNETIYLK